MKVLFVLSALAFFLVSGCSDQQELTGPWEMWVLVSNPVENEVWSSSDPLGRTVRWAAIPGDRIRCELHRNGEVVMEIFSWREKGAGEFAVVTDIASAGKGEGFTIVIHDDQGFFGTSAEFTIR